MEAKSEKDARVAEELRAGEWGEDLGWIGDASDHWSKFREVRHAMNVLGKEIQEVRALAEQAGIKATFGGL